MTKRSTARTRDRGRLAVAAVTGAATALSLTATGWVVGVAAADFEAEQVERETAQAKTERQRVLYELQVARVQQASARPMLRQRPTRTRVTTRYVTSGVSQSIGGGDLSAPTQSIRRPNSGPGSTSSGPASSAPPPPPPPPPASTSGS